MAAACRSGVAIGRLSSLACFLFLLSADARLAVLHPKWYEVGINRPIPCFPEGLREELFKFSWKKCCSALFGDRGNPSCFVRDTEIYNYDRCCVLWPEMGVEGLLPIHEERLAMGMSNNAVFYLHQDPGDGDHLTAQGVAVLYPGGYALARWADVCAPHLRQDRSQLQVLEIAAGVGLPANMMRWRWGANATATEIQPRSLAVMQHVARIEAASFEQHGAKPTLHAQHLDFMDQRAVLLLEERYDVVMSATIGCNPEQRAAAVGTARTALRPCGIAVFLECENKMRVIAASADELFGAGNRVLDDGPIPWDRKCDFRLTIWQRPMADGGACSAWPWGTAKGKEPARPGCLD